MRQIAYTITDLGFGDAGKGSVVDYLTRRHPGALIVRHNGGAQAAHNVVTPDGRHHTFSQFCSGMFDPTAVTYLSRYMIVDPLAMAVEAQRLDALGVDDVRLRTFIDPEALIVTPYQAIVNRIRERSRQHKHGSCGLGIGEAVSDSLEGCSLRAADIANAGDILRKARSHQMEKLRQIAQISGDWRDYASLSEVAVMTSDTALDVLSARYAEFGRDFQVVDRLATMMQSASTILFEGAQGVLLDEWHGFHPYTTWSTTTDANALAMLDQCGFAGDITRLGVVRTYMTRHGEGPLVTESSDLSSQYPEAHNAHGEFQGAFRCGHFDAVALRYAIAVNRGVDALFVTHCDRPIGRWSYCDAYLRDGGSLPPSSAGNADRIRDLTVSHTHDLAYQQALTQGLSECSPELSWLTLPRHHGCEALCAEVSHLLGVPVAAKSWGPCAHQKSEWNADGFGGVHQSVLCINC